MLYPFRFEPIFRQYIWGGRRLGEQLGKSIGGEGRYAESWDVVDHGSDQSIISNGPLVGQSLAKIGMSYGNDLYRSGGRYDRFPLLLKYLDCNRVLSVQVHPDDAYAQQMSPPDFGKTEAWYILSADPGSVIYAGLNEGVGPDDLRDACTSGQAENVLHKLHPKAGDCVFIPAGTVHALGSGLLVAEIQQSSDTTFRLFDWNRVDDNGQSRPLHLDQAIEVTNYDRGPVRFQTPQPLESAGAERLVDCDKFLMDRFAGTSETRIGGDGRFHILTVVMGKTQIRCADQPAMELSLGETTLLPASVGAITLTGQTEDTIVLRMSVPT